MAKNEESGLVTFDKLRGKKYDRTNHSVDKLTTVAEALIVIGPCELGLFQISASDPLRQLMYIQMQLVLAMI